MVELFRRGLPKTMQAYPGIIPVPGDDSQSYWGRLHRLTTGSSALSGLTELNTKLTALKDEDPSLIAISREYREPVCVDTRNNIQRRAKTPASKSGAKP